MNNNRRTLIIGIAILVIVALPVIWWLASPLFVERAVDEDFPFAVPGAAEMAAMLPEEAQAAVMEIMDEVEANPPDADQMATLEPPVMTLSAMMPDQPMADAMPTAAAEWVVVREGMFRDADSFHRGSGRATVFQQGDQRVLRFEDFEVTNGPDLHVLLVENADATNSAGMGRSVDLGSLKGNLGNQNYDIPADVNLDDFGGVMIYCVPFSVVFATAAWQ